MFTGLGRRWVAQAGPGRLVKAAGPGHRIMLGPNHIYSPQPTDCPGHPSHPGPSLQQEGPTKTEYLVTPGPEPVTSDKAPPARHPAGMAGAAVTVVSDNDNNSQASRSPAYPSRYKGLSWSTRTLAVPMHRVRRESAGEPASGLGNAVTAVGGGAAAARECTQH